VRLGAKRNTGLMALGPSEKKFRLRSFDFTRDEAGRGVRQVDKDVRANGASFLSKNWEEQKQVSGNFLLIKE